MKRILSLLLVISFAIGCGEPTDDTSTKSAPIELRAGDSVFAVIDQDAQTFTLTPAFRDLVRQSVGDRISDEEYRVKTQNLFDSIIDINVGEGVVSIFTAQCRLTARASTVDYGFGAQTPVFEFSAETAQGGNFSTSAGGSCDITRICYAFSNICGGQCQIGQCVAQLSQVHVPAELCPIVDFIVCTILNDL